MINLFNFPSVLQLLVVVSPDWNSVEGTLCCYQRQSSTSQWELVGSSIEVALGKQGMAWGRGLCDFADPSGLNKKEGDNRSPAGIFYLGTAFGDMAHQSYAKNLPFRLITADLEYIDDPNSEHYNQFFTAYSTSRRDWKSSEKMLEIGSIYALGLVVQHNLYPIAPGLGSAIFIHIWSGPGKGTAGCTAMAEHDLNTIVSWLNCDHHPCLVQLPLEEYIHKKRVWGLPENHSSSLKSRQVQSSTIPLSSF